MKDRVFSYWAKHEVVDYRYYCWKIKVPALPFEHCETLRIFTKLKYLHSTQRELRIDEIYKAWDSRLKHEVGEWRYCCKEINDPALPFEHCETLRIFTKLNYLHSTQRAEHFCFIRVPNNALSLMAPAGICPLFAATGCYIVNRAYNIPWNTHMLICTTYARRATIATTSTWTNRAIRWRHRKPITCLVRFNRSSIFRVIQVTTRAHEQRWGNWI